MRFRLWEVGDPEPKPDDIVSVEAMDCSWRLPWRQVREDAVSGFAAVYVEEPEDDRLS